MGYDLYIIGGAGLTQDEYYFRANISAMSLLRGVMASLGMLATAYSDDDVPREECYNEFLRSFCGDGRRTPEEADLEWYGEGSRALRHWRPTSPDPLSGEARPQWGIAVHKLCSNGFWRVEADECREALIAWEAAVGEVSAPAREVTRQDLRELLWEPSEMARLM